MVLTRCCSLGARGSHSASGCSQVTCHRVLPAEYVTAWCAGLCAASFFVALWAMLLSFVVMAFGCSKKCYDEWGNKYPQGVSHPVLTPFTPRSVPYALNACTDIKDAIWI